MQKSSETPYAVRLHCFFPWQTREDLDASKQDALKAKLKDELKKVLGDGSVYDVYITSFVLQ